jgi:hypothetical protein
MSDIDLALAALGRWALLEHRDHECGDIDGGSLQDKAKALGLLVTVRVTEPCGEYCPCAEWGDFPQECLRLAEGITL